MRNKKSILKRIKEDAKIEIPDVWDRIEKGVQHGVAPVKLKSKNLSIYIRVGIIAASLVFVAAIGVFIIASMAGRPPSSNLYCYGSYDQTSIVKVSNTIIIGEVLKINKPEKLNIIDDNSRTIQQIQEDLILFTVSDVKVLEVIKGDLKVGDIIKVKQEGDEKQEPDSNIIQGNGYLKESSQYAFFIDKYESGSPYSPCNPFQGIIKIKHNKIDSKNNIFENGMSKDEFVNKIKDTVQFLIDNPNILSTNRPAMPTVNPDIDYSKYKNLQPTVIEIE